MYICVHGESRWEYKLIIIKMVLSVVVVVM